MRSTDFSRIYSSNPVDRVADWVTRHGPPQPEVPPPPAKQNLFARDPVAAPTYRRGVTSVTVESSHHERKRFLAECKDLEKRIYGASGKAERKRLGREKQAVERQLQALRG